MRRWVAACALLLLLLGIFPHQARTADFVDVTVRIKCLEQVENPDTASGDGDYFPEVKIGSHDFSIHPTSSGPLGPGPIEDDTFCPDWRFTRNVDRTGPVDIIIRLWDDDGGLNFGGDRMDISPVNVKVELFIRYNALAGTWDTAESEVEGNIARDDGDHGFPEANDGRIARIEFEIFVGTNPDLDGDGIPDAIENNGVRKADGTLVADLKALGADPCRKSIIVWTDYMTGAMDGHSHEPKADGIALVVNACDRAPVDAVPCPYSGTHKPRGVGFNHIKGRSTPEQAVMGLDDGFRAARNANFPPELRPYAHYAIYVHDQEAGSSSSGLCCEDTSGDKDFIVSLGSWRATCVGPGADGVLQTTPQGDDIVAGTTIDVGPDRTCNSTATSDDGQCIAVGTGAADARVGIPRGATPAGAAMPPRVLDYSPQALGPLDKGKLKESAGIGTGLTDWTRFTGAGGATNVTATDALPAGVYYSTALDLGAGPRPDTVTRNADGTTTLVWNLGGLAAAGSTNLEYTARPGLLFLGGESLANNVSVTYQNSKGCTFGPVSASAATTVTVVPPSRDPKTMGFWRTHPELWLTETLARIQATDQRCDTDNDGQLSGPEVEATLAPWREHGRRAEEAAPGHLLQPWDPSHQRRHGAGPEVKAGPQDRRCEPWPVQPWWTSYRS